MVELNNFAPVLILTLNRYNHLKQCVESLSKCTYAEQTVLYVALDYPFEDSHWEGYNKICKYIENIIGFKSVIVIKRKENFGVRRNVMDARERIFKEYDRIILSEDDNIFSPDFLSYINKGLEVYKNREDIFSVIGYNYPVKLSNSYPNDVYLYNGFSAWGYGIWREKWLNLKWDIEELEKFLKDKKKAEEIMGKNLIKGLKKIVDTGHITGDTYICYYQTINKIYSIFPILSRVKNNGHDGSGIHGGDSKYLRKILLNQKVSDGTVPIYFPSDIKPDQSVFKSLKKYFNVPISKKILRITTRVINNFKKVLFGK